ncbi:MAG TPA: hypothetical protein VLE72_03240 [Candidatus Saccharimonadales bacterium]|nr:hypothetical protein [Candidatus Saccharimonadales bacterium]
MTAFDSYQQLLLSLWQRSDSFIIIEHDVVPYPSIFAELSACKREWCSSPYGSGAASLGCVKITKSLISKLPGLWEKMPLRHWQYCDSWFNENAERVSSVHYHQPVLAHLHADNPITAKGPLITRVRRQNDQEVEVAFYDPKIEYEFASMTLPRTKLSNEQIEDRVASELNKLNQLYFLTANDNSGPAT